MQVMPATWNFIQERLAGRRLDPASAADNVRAGTLYLHYLYHLKGTPGGTISSYYQGPNRTTLLPETHSYLHGVLGHQAHFRQPGTSATATSSAPDGARAARSDPGSRWGSRRWP